MPAIGNSAIILPPAANVARAFQTTIQLADPAPATNAAYMVAGNYYEVILSIFFQIQTDVTVGSRQGAVAFETANGRVFSLLASQQTQPASTLWDYTFGVSVATFGSSSAGVQTITAPLLSLEPGFILNIGALSFPGPADQVTAVTMVVQRYPTDAAAYAADVADPVPAPLAI